MRTCTGNNKPLEESCMTVLLDSQSPSNFLMLGAMFYATVSLPQPLAYGSRAS